MLLKQRTQRRCIIKEKIKRRVGKDYNLIVGRHPPKKKTTYNTNNNHQVIAVFLFFLFLLRPSSRGRFRTLTAAIIVIITRFIIIIPRFFLCSSSSSSTTSSSLFLLTTDDIFIELTTVLFNSTLLVIINGDLDLVIADVLFLRVVEGTDIGVLESVLSGITLVGVEGKEVLKDVDGLGRSSGIELLVGTLGDGREGIEHCESEGALDGLEIFIAGLASKLKDTIELVHGGASREHGLAANELTEDATDRPHIDTSGVLLAAEKDLRGAVPAGGNVVSKDVIAVDCTCETKVTDLEKTVAVKEEVGGLQITVDDASAVEVLEGLEELVDDELLVHLFEDVCADDGVKIGLHVLEHEVDIAVVLGLHNIQQLEDVLMIAELLKEHDLTEGSLCIGGVLEGIKDLLHSDDFASLYRHSLPHNTVSALTNALLNLITSRDLFVQLFRCRHFFLHCFPLLSFYCSNLTV